ncbi:MAG: hypothetical protein ACUVX9_12530, partial [Anaerolineae bacterium]
MWRHLVSRFRISQAGGLGRRIVRRMVGNARPARTAVWRPRAIQRVALAPHTLLSHAARPTEQGYRDYVLPERWAVGGRVIAAEFEEERWPVLPPDAWQPTPSSGAGAAPESHPRSVPPATPPRRPARAGVLRVEEGSRPAAAPSPAPTESALARQPLPIPPVSAPSTAAQRMQTPPDPVRQQPLEQGSRETPRTPIAPIQAQPAVDASQAPAGQPLSESVARAERSPSQAAAARPGPA